MGPIRGWVDVTKWERSSGRRLWRRRAANLEVYAGTDAIARLLGGDGAPYKIAAVGFGEGTATPTLGDTALTNPAYYRPIDTVSYVPASSAPAQLVLAFGLHNNTPIDYGALGLVVTELGLFCNPTSVSLPAIAGDTDTPRAVWQASHTYNVGDVIVDSNGNMQVCTTGGTSGGSHPTWATAVGGTTNDGSTLVWTCRALHTAPSLLFARVKFGLGLITSGSGFTTTWTLVIPPGQV